MNLKERLDWAHRFQKLLVQKSDLVVNAIQKDTGKTEPEALGIEVMTVLLTLAYYQKNATAFLEEKKVKTEWIFKNKKATVRRVPHGTVGILGPSNLPFALTIGDAIPALLAGNQVIIKPSERTPRSAEIGLQLARKAGLPENILQVIQGGPEVGEKLIEQADCIFFTGSTAIGRKVAVRCAELLKPCILELGGKAPMIVLEDADLERAARACVWGRFAHSGQHCIAIERVYVDQKIFDQFLTKLLRAMERVNIPLLKTERTEAFLQEALQQGAKLHGSFILTNVTPEMRVMREEAFGPILPIMTFRTEEEAITLANDSDSGLSAAIFTKDKKRGKNLAEKIEVGSVMINDVMSHFSVMDAPFAGWKNSGLGGLRHSREGMLQFTKPQTIFWQRFTLPFSRRREFWWFPYKKWSQNLLKILTRIMFG